MKYLPLALLLTSCGLFAPANSPRATKFDCQVEALKPLVGDVLDARALLQDLYSGKASLGAVLQNLDVGQAEAEALMQRLRACEPLPTPEAPDAS